MRETSMDFYWDSNLDSASKLDLWWYRDYCQPDEVFNHGLLPVFPTSSLDPGQVPQLLLDKRLLPSTSTADDSPALESYIDPLIIHQSEDSLPLDWTDDVYASLYKLTATPPAPTESEIGCHSTSLSTTRRAGSLQDDNGASPVESEDSPSSSSNAVPDPGLNSAQKAETAKRRAHYRVEKRYRTNINDKIRILEGILADTFATDWPWSPGAEGVGQDDASSCNGATRKRSKGEVLSRAIDYIMFLRAKDVWRESVIRDLEARMQVSRNALEP